MYGFSILFKELYEQKEEKMKYKFCPHCGEALREKVYITMESEKISDVDKKVVYKTTSMKINLSKENMEKAEELTKRKIR